MALNTTRNQVIALAGICQAVYQVKLIARTGCSDEDAVATSVGSILKIDADTVEAIYGSLDGIKIGLQQLQKQLTGMRIADPEQGRYAAALIYLEKQLVKNKAMLNTLSEGIEETQAQVEHFDITHENVLLRLGNLYHSTISTIQPQIMVHGEQIYLSSGNNNKIRSLLLAGIRAALLWRQCGGTRWKFLIHRKKLQDQTQLLLAELGQSSRA